MRFLTDHDVYARTVRLLKSSGHDVVSVKEMGLSRAADAALLEIANKNGRIFVTRDSDFGRLVFLERLRGGVIYLRMLPMTQDVVHAELDRVLGRYQEQELLRAFVVVEPGRHRFRRLPH